MHVHLYINKIYRIDLAAKPPKMINNTLIYANEWVDLDTGYLSPINNGYLNALLQGI